MRNLGLFGFVVWAIIIVVLTWIVTAWTSSNLDFWASYFQHKPVHVPGFLALILTVVLNGAIVVIDLVASILRFFVK